MAIIMARDLERTGAIRASEQMDMYAAEMKLPFPVGSCPRTAP
ncbi:hypothetical protein ACH40E_04100 [Streptomyces acidicola]